MVQNVEMLSEFAIALVQLVDCLIVNFSHFKLINFSQFPTDFFYCVTYHIYLNACDLQKVESVAIT